MADKKVKGYAVTAGYTQSELQDRVNKHIYEGWEPQGGVFVIILNPGELPEKFMFFQALVQKENKL